MFSNYFHLFGKNKTNKQRNSSVSVISVSRIAVCHVLLTENIWEDEHLSHRTIRYCRVLLRLHSTWLPSSKLETTSRELCFFLNLKPQKNSWELHIILLLCSFLAVNSHWFVMKYYYNLFNNGSVNLFKDIRKCSTTEKCQGLAIYKKNSQICCIEKFCALKLQS